FSRDWSSDVCSSDLVPEAVALQRASDPRPVGAVALVHDRRRELVEQLAHGTSWETGSLPGRTATAVPDPPGRPTPPPLPVSSGGDRKSTRLNSSHVK